MKKIYLLLSSAVLLSLSTFAQEIPGPAAVQGAFAGVSPITHNPDRLVLCPDTAGLANYTDFFPEFLPAGTTGLWIFSYTNGGYIYGNNKGSWNLFAQGFLNNNPTPVRVKGALIWVRYKQRDGAGGATSKVQVGAYAVVPNEGYNADGTGTFNQTTKNWPGPAAGAPAAVADLFYDAMDTVPKNYTIRGNYVTFPAPGPAFTGDFAISVNSRTQVNGTSGAALLTAGDTIGILCDAKGDQKNLDYTWHQTFGGKWYVTDALFGAAPSFDGGLDQTVAAFPVLCDATGVNEYFNGMKLTTYPNPAVESVTLEYALEKNSTKVSLTIYDQLGKTVFAQDYGTQGAGTYKVGFETANLPSGNYFYQLRANGTSFTKSFVVTAK